MNKVNEIVIMSICIVAIISFVKEFNDKKDTLSELFMKIIFGCIIFGSSGSIFFKSDFYYSIMNMGLLAGMIIRLKNQIKNKY